MKSGGKSRHYDLWGPALFFVMGLVLLMRAHYADVHHTTIWRGPKAASMEPWQGYLGAAFCVVATAFTLTSALRRKNRDDI